MTEDVGRIAGRLMRGCVPAQAFGTLKELAAAVSAIQGVLRRTDRDMSVLDEELSGRSSDMAIVPSYA